MFAASKTAAPAAAANYIEDVFSTYLYTGNSTSGGTQTITNSIDLSTKGGMVWIKGRSAASNHILTDTTRGAGASATNNNALASNLTDAEDLGGSSYDFLSAFNTDGFTVKQGGTTAATRGTNYDAVTYVSWTFRKQAKFFDVVTYTGNGTAGRTVAHSLGSVPGCIMVKRTDTTGSWQVYHRSRGNTVYLVLNTTAAEVPSTTRWNDTDPTSTEFSLGTDANVNANGGTYVAYLFAHDAGGFGLTGTDNVITCGEFTTDSGGAASVTLGYEPQWVMWKMSSLNGTGWWMFDTMRGMTVEGQNDALLQANSSGAEIFNSDYASPNATGFTVSGVNGSQTFIYIAIRRGPMKTPTTGTSVYEGTTRTGTGAAASISGLSFPPDAVITRNRDSNGSSRYAVYDKLRGPTIYLDTAATDAEFTVAQSLTSFNQTGESFGTHAISNFSGDPYINWQFRRAPGFFDVVCYTGTGANRTVSHNLGVVPELMIVKGRDNSGNWSVYVSAVGTNKALRLNTDDAPVTSTAFWNDTAPTASVFSLGTTSLVNQSTFTYVNYLFASCPGVSKVGTYTGTGTTKQIDCGFTGGARFVLIKRTDSTGDWYVWDSARGIVSGNDPYLLLNSTAAEVTNTDYIDTYSAGFEISSTAPAAINANGGTFIFLAIA